LERFSKLAACIPSWSWLSYAGPIEFQKTIQPDESIQELSTAQITSYPPVTAFLQISVLHSQILQPPSFRIYGKIHICQFFPWDFYYMQRNWEFIPRAEEHSLALEYHIQRAWDIYEDWGTDGFTDMCPLPEYTLPSFFNYYPDTPDQHRRDLTCLLLSRTWDNVTVTDSGLVLEPVHTGSKTYRRVGSFDSSLSDWMYEHWLQKRMRGRFYPRFASNLDEGVVRSPAGRESFDISQLDMVEDIKQGLEHYSTQENDTPDSPGRYSPSAYPPEFYTSGVHHRMSSPPVTESAKQYRLASLVKCLRIFNGTEEEAEIEIV
jgi:hypothetical protein